MDIDPPDARRVRDRNPRGKGERLREDIIEAATRMLDELGDDQALSMRAVAREIGSAATSVYLHFTDRDELVVAVLNRCHDNMLAAIDTAEAGHADPVAALRARTLILGKWAYQHPGLYKVLHESTLNQRTNMEFKRELADGMIRAIQRCMDAKKIPIDDAATVALDLRSAVHGAVSIRLNQPSQQWPSLEEQVDRFLSKIAGVTHIP